VGGGLGFGDWGLGIGPNPQSPIPNPQSPIPNPQSPIIGYPINLDQIFSQLSLKIYYNCVLKLLTLI